MRQLYTANGAKLETPVNYDGTWDETLLLNNSVHGYVGFDIESGLVKVVTEGHLPIRTMRVGKFLKRSNVEEGKHNAISKLASDLYKANKTELKFTASSEEVVHVYKNGPRSCMQNCDAVAVYATDDVAVAYLELDGVIIARAVVTTVDNHCKYTRAYGEVSLMEHKLIEAGWHKDTLALDGMWVRHLRDESMQLMMPYLDGCATYVDEPNVRDEYITISTSGDICCEDTCGRPQIRTCDTCDDRMPEDDGWYSDYLGQNMCEACFEACHERIDGTWYHHDELTETEDDGYMLPDDTCYVSERGEAHPLDCCVYNNYTEKYHLRSDLDL